MRVLINYGQIEMNWGIHKMQLETAIKIKACR